MTDKLSYRDWTKKMLDVDKKTLDPEEKPVESPESYVANRVLVVDDEEIVRMIMEDILTKAGYEVILASDGEEGIRMFQDNAPALVVTDIIMPKKSGTEFILEILAEHPSAKFIAMSAGGEMDPEVTLAIPKTINIQTIAKPFEPEAMLTVVKKLIGPPVATS